MKKSKRKTDERLDLSIRVAMHLIRLSGEVLEVSDEDLREYLEPLLRKGCKYLATRMGPSGHEEYRVIWPNLVGKEFYEAVIAASLENGSRWMDEDELLAKTRAKLRKAKPLHLDRVALRILSADRRSFWSKSGDSIQ